MRQRLRRVAFAVMLVGLLPASHVAASPESPEHNFCPGEVSSKSGVESKAVVGVTHTASVFVPIQAVPAGDGTSAPVGIYFSNDGPGPVTFATPSWATKAGPIPRETWTQVELTPRGTVLVNDNGWSGTFADGSDFLGCLHFRSDGSSVPKGTLHLDLHLVRGDAARVVRVNVHFR
jgi:hypothetical protein